MKKDQQEATERQDRMEDDSLTSDCSNDIYDKSMDDMTCVLYFHGGTVVSLFFESASQCLPFVVGGYYFGSVDQAR